MKAFVVAAPGVGSTSRPCTPSRPSTWLGSRCRATSKWWTSFPTPPPAAWPSTSCPRAAPRRSSTLAEPRFRFLDRLVDADTITVAGRDLPSEIMGRLTLTELAYLLVTHREPTAAERRMLDAVLVSLADHGLTPSALATRLTYTGAPESVQGAVAAGLLGAGSVFLGPAGDTAQFLADVLADAGPDADGAVLADEAVRARRAEGQRVPGLGHPVHKDDDPRTPRLYELAEAEGLLGPHLRLLPSWPTSTSGSRASTCRSTAPAPPARPSSTSGSRRERAGLRAHRPHRRAGRPPRRGGRGPDRHAPLARGRRPRLIRWRRRAARSRARPSAGGCRARRRSGRSPPRGHGPSGSPTPRPHRRRRPPGRRCGRRCRPSRRRNELDFGGVDAGPHLQPQGDRGRADRLGPARTARAGPSKWARRPSPKVLTTRPRWSATLVAARRWNCSSIARHFSSPRWETASVEATRSTKSTVVRIRSAASMPIGPPKDRTTSSTTGSDPMNTRWSPPGCSTKRARGWPRPTPGHDRRGRSRRPDGG